MSLTVALMSIRLFVRQLLGLILLSVSASKLARPGSFRRDIQDYQIVSSALEAKLVLSTILAYALPAAEMLAGLGLISGLLLVPAALLAIILMFVFSAAIAINLVRGRRDLSCHCSGAIGDHQLSWWLIVRNGLLTLSFLFLLLTPADMFTIGTLIHSPSALSASLWVNTVLPVVLLVGMVLVVLVLFNAARTLLRS